MHSWTRLDAWAVIILAVEATIFLTKEIIVPVVVQAIIPSQIVKAAAATTAWETTEQFFFQR